MTTETTTHTDLIPVLDHGYVRLVGSLGTDQSIAQAAAVSYGKDKVEKTGEQVRRLLSYLIRHRHTSPFEQAVVQLEIKCPIFVARQFHRHRTQSINEISGRYAELPVEWYTPTTWYKQSTSNKQGSGEELWRNHALSQEYDAICDAAFDEYKDNISSYDMSREQARMILPVSTYTRYVTTMNLHNCLHFLKLRLDSHAQFEARQYAEAIWRFIQDLFPVTSMIWEDEVLNSVTLSGSDAKFVRAFLTDHFTKDSLKQLADTAAFRKILT